MDVIENPEIYVPSMNSTTKGYCDHNVIHFSKGIICPCTPSKVFYKKVSFKTHKETNKHKSWLEYLNANSQNYYKECLIQEKTIKEQHIIMNRLENEIQKKDIIIQYLETSINKQQNGAYSITDCD